MYPFKRQVEEKVVQPVRNSVIMSCVAMVLAALALIIAVMR